MKTETIVLAGGCFWGMQELLRKQAGVITTEVGYTGGRNDNPTYANHPGHAEAVKVVFSPEQLSLPGLLAYFFQIHDPTTLRRQGNDIGASYRSAIFWNTEEQMHQVSGLASSSRKWKKRQNSGPQNQNIRTICSRIHEDTPAISNVRTGVFLNKR